MIFVALAKGFSQSINADLPFQGWLACLGLLRRVAS